MELWSLSSMGAITLGDSHMSDIFVRMRSRRASFLVGFFMICFKVKCLSKGETGHLLESPSKNIPSFGYLYFKSYITNPSFVMKLNSLAGFLLEYIVSLGLGF